jgi:hypothetical protein
MTALCRTRSPEPVENRPGIHHNITFPMAQIAPDPVQVISCHEERIGVFKKGHMSHPFWN